MNKAQVKKMKRDAQNKRKRPTKGKSKVVNDAGDSKKSSAAAKAATGCNDKTAKAGKSVSDDWSAANAIIQLQDKPAAAARPFHIINRRGRIAASASDEDDFEERGVTRGRQRDVGLFVSGAGTSIGGCYECYYCQNGFLFPDIADT